jgi:hypothetical protein
VVKFSKGDDPRFISDLETAHKGLNHWVRTAVDPMDVASTIPEFEFHYNSAAGSRSGMSAAGLAFGPTPAAARALAVRHRSLLWSVSDSKEPTPPMVPAGHDGRWIRDAKNTTQAATVIVPVLLVLGSSSLIREPGGMARWVPSRNVVPVGPRKPLSPSAPSEDPAAPSAARRSDRHHPLEPVTAPEQFVDENVALRNCAIGDWVVYSDGGKCHVGVVSDVNRNGQVHLHTFAAKKDLFLPEWQQRGGLKTKVSRSRPKRGDWVALNYLISALAIVWRGPRQADTYSLPLAAEKAIADWRRDPLSSEYVLARERKEAKSTVSDQAPPFPEPDSAAAAALPPVKIAPAGLAPSRPRRSGRKKRTT